MGFDSWYSDVIVDRNCDFSLLASALHFSLCIHKTNSEYIPNKSILQTDHEHLDHFLSTFNSCDLDDAHLRWQAQKGVYEHNVHLEHCSEASVQKCRQEQPTIATAATGTIRVTFTSRINCSETDRGVCQNCNQAWRISTKHAKVDCVRSI